MSEKELRENYAQHKGLCALIVDFTQRPDIPRRGCDCGLEKALADPPDVVALVKTLAKKRNESRAEYERLKATEGPIRSLFLKTSATLRNIQHDFDLGEVDDDVDARCDEITALLENPLGEPEPETYGALMEWTLAEKMMEWIQCQFHIRLTDDDGWEWTE